MGVAVNEAGEERLAAPVVDLGLGIRLEDLVGGADRRDPAGVDRERHVVLNVVDSHDGCMREDDRSTRCRLSLDTALLEKEGCGGGAGAGEQLAPVEVAGAAGGL